MSGNNEPPISELTLLERSRAERAKQERSEDTRRRAAELEIINAAKAAFRDVMQTELPIEDWTPDIASRTATCVCDDYTFRFRWDDNAQTEISVGTPPVVGSEINWVKLNNLGDLARLIDG